MANSPFQLEWTTVWKPAAPVVNCASNKRSGYENQNRQ